MGQTYSKEFLEYVADLIVRNSLLQSGDVDLIPVMRHSRYEWITELADAMYAEGYLIERIFLMIHDTHDTLDQAPTEMPSVTWHGYCFDERNKDFAFVAEWRVNMDKFRDSYNTPHYYELVSIDLEPRRAYDKRQRARNA